MSNFLYGFQEPPHFSHSNSHSPPSGIASFPTRGIHHHHRDPLGFSPSDNNSPALRNIHHHPHHHPHLTLRPSMHPTTRRTVITTLAPLLSQHVTTSIPTRLLHPPQTTFDDHLDSMKNYFHTDAGDTILFKSWILKSTWDIILTCVAFLLLAMLYEGIKCYREHLFKRLSFAVQKQITVPVLGTSHHHHYPHHSHSHHPHHSSSVNIQQTNCRRDSTHHTSSHTNPVSSGPIFRADTGSSILIRLLSVPHVVQTLLHIVQVFLSYILMIAFMTFNLYICLSIITGAGLGYFMFYWRKITVVHVTDCN